MQLSTEQVILQNLLRNENYTRKVLPFLVEEYFHTQNERIIFSTIKDFVTTYNAPPTPEVLLIDINDKKGISGPIFDEIKKSIEVIKSSTAPPANDWLIKTTESFCQEKAVYNAIMKSIDIMNGKQNLQKGAIPGILSDALAVTFDPNVGHDYLDQSDQRYEYYHRKEEKIPFDLEKFNTITKDGLPKKTLNIILAGCVHPETKVKVRYRKKC